jgi:3-dehydroquinate synthase
VTTRIPVRGDRPYDVLIGRGLAKHLPELIGSAARTAVLFAPPLLEQAAAVARELPEPLMMEVPDAEAGKTVEVAARCWDALGAAGFTRTDAVVGVGGGAVTDLAGFVAASWLRGVRWVPVSTSLLGMVDAAVGGKTGVNVAAGKNLVGAFHAPAGVLCDLDMLDTLPPDDLVAGLAEVVKCGFIADPVILDLLSSHRENLRELIERAIKVKAEVVGQDLRESGLREILNYGHTLAGRLSPDVARRHRSGLERLGLPVSYDADAFPELLAAMQVDKKTRGATLRFVVLDGLGQPGILTGPAPELLEQAYAEVAA